MSSSEIMSYGPKETYIVNAPRVLAFAAASLAVATLIVLCGKMIDVAGTTAEVSRTFKNNCFSIAKWGGIGAAGFTGIGLVANLGQGIIVAKNTSAKEGLEKFGGEALITVGSATLLPLILSCRK